MTHLRSVCEPLPPAICRFWTIFCFILVLVTAVSTVGYSCHWCSDKGNEWSSNVLLEATFWGNELVV